MKVVYWGILAFLLLSLNWSFPREYTKDFSLPTSTSNILIDSVHGTNPEIVLELRENFWGDYAPFFPLSYKVLKNYDYLIIDSPQIKYLDSEILEIKKFVQEGGVVIFMASWDTETFFESNLNQVLKNFGARFEREIVYGFESFAPSGWEVGSKYFVAHYNEYDLYFSNAVHINFDDLWEKVFVEGFTRERGRVEFPLKLGRKPQILGIREFGEGRIYVVGDHLDLGIGDNREFLKSIFNGEREKDEGYLKAYNKEMTSKTLKDSLEAESLWREYFFGKGIEFSESPLNKYVISIFFVKVLVLGAVFFYAARGKKSLIYFVILLAFFFSTFSDVRTYNPEKMVIPESVPAQLISQNIEKNPLEVERFVSEIVEYTYTEKKEFFSTPLETLSLLNEDCDGQAFLAASILKNMGFDAKVVFGEGHAWVEVEDVKLFNPKNFWFLKFDNEKIMVNIVELIYTIFTYSLKLDFLKLMIFGIIFTYKVETWEDLKISLLNSFLFSLIFFLTVFLSYFFHFLIFFIFIFFYMFCKKPLHGEIFEFLKAKKRESMIFISLAFFLFLVLYPIYKVVATGEIVIYYLMALIPLLFTAFLALYSFFYFDIHNK